LLAETPWFEPGKPLRNYMLHETDFYDEVEQIWGRRWGAEGIGKLREVLVSRPSENEIRPEYAREWQYYYSSAAGNADLVKLPGSGLVVRGGVIMHRYGLGSWQRGREVIWSKAFSALQLPVYLTIHGRGICEPGAGRWLDEKTFVFNESVVANEEGLRQLQFVLEGLGVEFVLAHSPG